MKIGASFSQTELKYLKIDPKKAIQEYKDLGLKYIRLGSYWRDIEVQRDKYDFSDLDYFVNYCQRNGIKVLLNIGIKSPRWPEFYPPSWLKSFPSRRLSVIKKDNKEVYERTLLFIEKIVRHYKNNQSIITWQVENEPLDTSGAKWMKIDFNFLKEEISLVRRLDPNRKILTTLWGGRYPGKTNTYKELLHVSDVLGFDFYLRYPIPVTGFYFITTLFKKYMGPFIFKQKLIKISDEIRQHEKEVWIAELQAEPWEATEELKFGNNPQSFLPEHFEKNIEFIKPMKPEIVFLWGFEYWLWRKLKGDLHYWTDAKKIINKHS